MTSSTLFISNRRQAVRLPKAVAFPEDERQVDILKTAPPRQRRFLGGAQTPGSRKAQNALMLVYMLDTNICIYVIKRYPLELREKFNTLAEQLCISSITLAELYYGAEKSARRRREPRADHRTTCRSAATPAARD
jgi:hypothetical protein